MVWLRQEARKVWVQQGRWDEVRAMDEKYGPPEDCPSASQDLRQPFASFPPGFSSRT
jgi:hypothetical protein